MNDKLIVFFYVDDIVVLCPPAYIETLSEIERKLLQRYEIRSLGPLRTFCGMQVQGDRDWWLDLDLTGSVRREAASEVLIAETVHKGSSDSTATRRTACRQNDPSNDVTKHRHASKLLAL